MTGTDRLNISFQISHSIASLFLLHSNSFPFFFEKKRSSLIRLFVDHLSRRYESKVMAGARTEDRHTSCHRLQRQLLEPQLGSKLSTCHPFSQSLTATSLGLMLFSSSPSVLSPFFALGTEWADAA